MLLRAYNGTMEQFRYPGLFQGQGCARSMIPKRPMAPNQLVKSIIDIATAQTAEPAETGLIKRGRAGGTKGGPARANAMTPEQRSVFKLTATRKFDCDVAPEMGGWLACVVCAAQFFSLGTPSENTQTLRIDHDAGSGHEHGWNGCVVARSLLDP
jgi:hypothetical protein